MSPKKEGLLIFALYYESTYNHVKNTYLRRIKINEYH